MSAVDNLLVGAIDLHCHSAPSPMPRSVTHVEAARQANEVGMRAILAKCHYHSTAFDIIAMQPELAGLKTQVFGGVALNSPSGGINPHAVNLTLQMGGRMIWFPTISSSAHLAHAAQNAAVQSHFQPEGLLQCEEVDILGSDGDLLPEARQIIGMAKDARALISAGHLPPDRIRPLLQAVREAGHDQFVISHPNFVIEASNEQVVEFADMGATIEHELGMYDENGRFGIEVLLDWINLVGPERTTIASDLGQKGRSYPVDAYRRVLAKLLDNGVSEKDIRQMIAVNPARLLALD
jgi:hypothetical protein